MSAPLLLYRCDPLHATLSERQCLANQRKCVEGRAAPINSLERTHALTVLHTCHECPGVFELARRSGHEPRPAAELVEKKEHPANMDTRYISFAEICEKSHRSATWVRRHLDLEPVVKPVKGVSTLYDRTEGLGWIQRHSVPLGSGSHNHSPKDGSELSTPTPDPSGSSVNVEKLRQFRQMLEDAFDDLEHEFLEAKRQMESIREKIRACRVIEETFNS